MARPKIDLNRNGVQVATLMSPEVRAAVRAEAERIAGRARSAARNDNEFVVTERFPHKRAGAYVHRIGSLKSGPGAAGEAEDRALGSAVGGVQPVQRFKYTTKSGKTIMATQAQIDNWTRVR